MVKNPRKARRGLTLMSLCVVVSAVGAAVAMALSVLGTLRHESRVTVAVSRLRGISTGLNLHFNTMSRFPKQGANLAVALADFVPDPGVFASPLMSEPEPGHTVSALYQQPTLREADRPENYLTSMIAEEGDTVVVLKTLGKVDRVGGLHFDPRSRLSSFRAAGRQLIVAGTGATQYAARATTGQDGAGEELRGAGTRFEAPHSPLGGNGRLQAHVFSIPANDVSAVWNVSLAVETEAGSANPSEAPKAEPDGSGRLGGLGSVGLGFWARYHVVAGEIRLTVASDGENTPDPLQALTVYISGTEVLPADAAAQQVTTLDLE